MQEHLYKWSKITGTYCNYTNTIKLSNQWSSRVRKCAFLMNEQCLCYYRFTVPGVDETVATADICYFYGAVSVGGESSWHCFCCFWHLGCERNRNKTWTHLLPSSCFCHNRREITQPTVIIANVNDYLLTSTTAATLLGRIYQYILSTEYTVRTVVEPIRQYRDNVVI